jgi:hypothetical protein
MKLPVIISSTVGIFTIVGGLYAFDCLYARAEEHQQLKTSFERSEMRRDAKELRNRMWDIQRNVGEEKGKSTREYKELEDERDLILLELGR